MRSQTSPPSSHASPKLELSFAQVLGSAAATLSAAVLTSFAGVKGTLIGVAGMSVIATSGSAVYSHALRRSHIGLRRSLAQPGRAVRPCLRCLGSPDGVASASRCWRLPSSCSGLPSA